MERPRKARLRRASSVVIAADIGNTNVTLGAFEGGRLVHRWRLETDPSRGAASYGADVARRVRAAYGRRAPEGFAFGSVVPRLDPAFRRIARDTFGLRPVEVTPKSPLGFRIRVDKPSQVGADRLLNCLAAGRLYGGPAVVVDFGTATTFDCVSKRGDYLGGAILPGPRVAARALALKAAKLPEVRIAPSRRVIGKNTVECLQAGLYYGYLGMVERVLKETLREMGGGRVILTGGLAPLFQDGLSRRVRVDPDLTLQGLRLAFETFC